ncbi:DNA-binding protein [Pandoraea communis]|uniref:DNA-binding protein n=1 Tax=Pandoraea communis TaxID=2508297 RepID=A0A5E4Y097_9BURK|nr:DNA-binding protein [Pandoraea communis]VVE41735.1 DNA-binding protein [Pandoraea communis]
MKKQPVRIEHALRRALTGPGRQNAMAAVGWDESQVSRFLSGGQGIVIDKIDALFSSSGYRLVSDRYFEAITTLCKVGAHCECARRGLGECGLDVGDDA